MYLPTYVLFHFQNLHFTVAILKKSSTVTDPDQTLKPDPLILQPQALEVVGYQVKMRSSCKAHLNAEAISLLDGGARVAARGVQQADHANQAPAGAAIC